MNKCNYCNKEIPDNSKFCPYCGKSCSRTKVCPECQSDIDINSRFCNQCGYKFENNDANEKTVDKKYLEFEQEQQRIKENSKYIIRSNSDIYFGSYPQTIKDNSVTITSQKNGLGYYLGSDGKYYEKVITTQESWAYQYSNGVPCKLGKVEYFLVEPIKWRIRYQTNNTLMLIADCGIDVHRFDSISNKYSKSEIHSWLNNEFLNKAFNQKE